MAVEPIRHLSIFNVDKFNPTSVEVIGCGAIGSRVGLGLAKLGVESIRIWDYDKVEDTNVANQIFGNKHVGKPKAKCLAEIIEDLCGIKVDAREEKVDGSQKLRGAIFMCPDTMSSRKEIWLKSIKLKPQVSALFECRMGADNCRVYYVNPLSVEQVKDYEETLYDDEETEESVCGSKISVGPTAEFTSALMQWKFIRWFNSTIDDKCEAPENEAILELNPIGSMLSSYEE